MASSSQAFWTSIATVWCGRAFNVAANCQPVMPQNWTRSLVSPMWTQRPPVSPSEASWTSVTARLGRQETAASAFPAPSQLSRRCVCVWHGVTALAEEGSRQLAALQVLFWSLLRWSRRRARPGESGPSRYRRVGPSTGPHSIDDKRFCFLYSGRWRQSGWMWSVIDQLSKKNNMRVWYWGVNKRLTRLILYYFLIAGEDAGEDSPWVWGPSWRWARDDPDSR